MFNSYYGYKTDGFFQSYDEIAHSAVPTGKSVKPGDVKFKDRNGDGTIDENDRYYLGNAFPRYTLGFTYNVAWKGIDLSMTWAGAGGFSIYWRYLGFNSYSTRGNTTIPKEIAYDHYFFDPENPADPRTNLTSKHGRLTMNYGSRDNVVVPDRAVVKQMGSGDRYIYVYQQDGTVKFQKVELGRRMSDRYEITAGLADGDEIVVKGQNALNNGVSVERVNE